MLYALLSPAKRQDFDTPIADITPTQPLFKSQIATLLEQLRQYSPAQLKKLMSLSDALTDLNHQRIAEFDHQHFTPENARPALQAFQGDAFRSLNISDFSAKDWQFAQQHLGILSGLYGLLRPQDLIQPYRLEMKIPLKTTDADNLYQFWDTLLAEAINQQLTAAPADTTIINLASNEYSQAVNRGLLGFQMVDVQFKEFKNGQYKVVAVVAKRARGAMARFIIKHQLKSTKQLQSFDESGYAFNADLSSANQLVFTRAL